MDNCKQKFGEIVPGSKSEFTLVLTDEDGPLNLTPYASGKLVFCNLNGVRTEITLTVPGANPGSGLIPVVITPVQSANADDNWINADLELVDGAAALKVVPLADKFKITKRFCPPAV